MEGKKISFGFKKIKKVETPVINEEREYIDCVEEKSIKVVGGDPIVDNTPLVIPMKPNTLMTAEKLQLIAEKVESALEEPPEIKVEKIEEEPPPENESLEQMAVRELMREAKKEIKVETPDLTISVPAKPIMDGEKESTLDDYESVPIQDFGMAMLRGMGWQPNKDQQKYKQPQIRPKGLGLGADKVIKDNQKKNTPKDSKGEELSIVKNSFVKITTGKFSGYYGKIVSLDEDNGRVMVDIPVKKETVSLSEFMMQPVTKAEYDKESKVINAESFQEYKRSENLPKKSSRPEEKEPSSSHRTESSKNHKADNHRRQKDYENSSNGKSRKNRDSSEDRSHRRREKRYSSCDSLSSLSDKDRKKKKKGRRKHHSSSESEKEYRRKKSATPEGKRDIDKKRKGKKKKRDRDRSPHYRKHKK